MMKSHAIRQNCAAFLAALFLVCFCSTADAQNTPEMREILSRLERLELENHSLTEEIRALRKEVSVLRPPSSGTVPSEAVVAAASANDAPAPAPGETSDAERLAIEQSRVEELAQTKVESSQKFPIRITGMALFNASLNGQNNNNADNPTIASLAKLDDTGGATLRQSTLGLLFNGPRTFAGGKVSGSLYMDFFGGSTSSLNHLFRIRTAEINLDWTNTSFAIGQDKPIISPRDPDSLAQVGVSPLTSAGNPWLWQPQIRVEQRVSLGSDSGLRARAGVFQTSLLSATSDPNAYIPSPPGTLAEYSRPGAEGRLELWHRWGDTARFEIAAGFHLNRNHVGSVQVPSEVFSTDWFFRPFPKLEFSGMFFNGQNVSPLGALRPGFTVFPGGTVIAVHSSGGWAQIRIPVTARLAFDFYGGQQDNRNSDLLFGNIDKNQAYFANAMYRLAPNVILSLEGGQVRTTYKGQGNRLNNHYDIAIAYLF